MLDAISSGEIVELSSFKLPKISRLDKKYVFTVSGSVGNQLTTVVYDNRQGIVNNGKKKNRLHTIIQLDKLEKLVGSQRVNERTLEWHHQRVLNGESLQSMNLYLTIDEFVTHQYQNSAGYLGIDDYEILVLSKQLGLKEVGVFIRAPGYEVATMPLVKLFDWINKGIKKDSPRSFHMGLLTMPLVTLA